MIIHLYIDYTLLSIFRFSFRRPELTVSVKRNLWIYLQAFTSSPLRECRQHTVQSIRGAVPFTLFNDVTSIVLVCLSVCTVLFCSELYCAVLCQSLEWGVMSVNRMIERQYLMSYMISRKLLQLTVILFLQRMHSIHCNTLYFLHYNHHFYYHHLNIYILLYNLSALFVRGLCQRPYMRLLSVI